MSIVESGSAQYKSELEKRVDRIDMLFQRACRVRGDARQIADHLYGVEPEEGHAEEDAAPTQDGAIACLDRSLDDLERVLIGCEYQVARLAKT